MVFVQQIRVEIESIRLTFSDFYLMKIIGMEAKLEVVRVWCFSPLFYGIESEWNERKFV